MDKDFRAGFASYTFSNLFASFTKFAADEMAIILEVNSELGILERLFVRVQEMVDQLEFSRATFAFNVHSKTWISWLTEANLLLYDVSDLFEEFSRNLGHQKGDNLEIWALIKEFMLSAPHKITVLSKKLQALLKEMEVIFFADVMKIQDPKAVVRKHCYRFPYPVNQIMIGREDLLMKVFKVLMETMAPICITGMGGIGKSFFTQCLCSNKDVKNAYPLIIWVSINVNFDLVEVTRLAIESISKKSCCLMDLEALRSTLKGLLFGKDFIVVLDDFDMEDYEVWNILCDLFEIESMKRKLILTSRNAKLSNVVGAKVFCLPTLTNADCWEIMKLKPFLNNHTQNLEVLGIELAKMCRGLPLLAKIIGDMLHSLPDREWDSILRCSLWDAPQFKTYVIPKMLLSYSYLPSQLKKCFSYLSVFPPGFDYEMKKIVLLWMAEGLIDPIRGRRMDDMGREYFKELVYRSFLHSSNGDPYDFGGLYKMHDFTHHLATLISSGICQCSEDKKASYSADSARHLSICHGDSRSVHLKKFAKSNKLRTFLWLCANGVHISQHVQFFFENFKALRVLDLDSSGITKVPDSVSDFEHLRYLNLANNSIRRLPDSICKVSSLLVLILKNCTLIRSLPQNFCQLTKLEHFEFDIKNQLYHMPINFRFLVNMQTLGAFIVGTREGCKIEEIKHLSLLSGSICITGLENVYSREQAAIALLNDKKGITKLELAWRLSRGSDVQQEVLAGLEPHENLEELIISNYSGKIFPMWLTERHTCRLKLVHLLRCQHCDTLPVLGNLRFLEHLIIECLPVETVCLDVAEFGNYPSLRSLYFVEMLQLQDWGKFGTSCMHKLRELKFNNCPNLQRLPLLCRLICLEKIEFSGCENLNYLPGLPNPTINTVIIQDSPMLKICCQPNGLLWSQMKKVVNLQIDGVDIPTTPGQA